MAKAFKTGRSGSASDECIVVDDHEGSRLLIEEHIARVGESLGLNLVSSCEDAIEALKILREQTIDLIILDVSMPGMTGLELMKSLSDPPQVILVTASEEHAVEAFESNVTDYLFKPVSQDRFVKAVNPASEPRRDENGCAEELSVCKGSIAACQNRVEGYSLDRGT